MPPRPRTRNNTSRVLPGGALETTFQLSAEKPGGSAIPNDDEVRSSPPVPRRRRRTRQPHGDDNLGGDPIPMRTRRRQHQAPPTPAHPASDLDLRHGDQPPG
ncbi:hypothetical protein C8R43DRAFT_947325 [Mycena crocata]|nr:hypothetical protein C8R43DRAFT_947325 [Mycena crocata]